MTKYQYCIGDNDEFYEFQSNWGPEDPEYLAEDATYLAEDAVNHWFDGGKTEDDWPLEITVKTMDGEEIGVFIVEMEIVPQFTAERKG
jgi:hypothetical protein